MRGQALHRLRLVSLMRLRPGLPTTEEAGEEPASTGRTAGEFALQLLDAALSGAQRLLLHHDGLGHIEKRIRLLVDPRADELRRLRTGGVDWPSTWASLAEELFNGLTILMVHEVQSFLSNEVVVQGLLFPLPGEAEQELEDVDEVQVEGERAEHGHLAVAPRGR